MLVLSRQRDESIMIGDDVEVFALGFGEEDGHKFVRLGITAPKNVSVHRKEVYDAMKRKSEEAMGDGCKSTPKIASTSTGEVRDEK